MSPKHRKALDCTLTLLGLLLDMTAEALAPKLAPLVARELAKLVPRDDSPRTIDPQACRVAKAAEHEMTRAGLRRVGIVPRGRR